METSSNNSTPSNSDSPTSSNSELEKELGLLEISARNGTNGTGSPNNATTNTSLSGAGNDSNGTTSTTAASTANANAASTGGVGGTASSVGSVGSLGSLGKSNGSSSGGNNTMKKRASSSRAAAAAKARRIRFYRNGDRFYAGIVIAVSAERYRSFESLVEDLTRLMEDRVCGAVRNIYSVAGRRIATLDEIEDGTEYVCLCNKEAFKRLDYTSQPQPPAGAAAAVAAAAAKQANRLSRHIRSGSPHIGNTSNGSATSTPNTAVAAAALTTSSSNNGASVTDSVCPPSGAASVHPRIVTLIRNGTKPRRVLRLLLNKRNSPSYDHVLTAITQCVKLDSGCVRKVFTLAGTSVQQLGDFFELGSTVFFAYGTERVQPDDFRLDADEQRAVAASQQTRRSGGGAGRNGVGVKPRMPVKNSVNLHNKTYDAAEIEAALLASDEKTTTSAAAATERSPTELGNGVGVGGWDLGLDPAELPERIRADYSLGPIVGDGNFAVVLRVQGRATGKKYALKIIDKSKCKGKEHYIDAEVRVMKKLRHPHIMGLICDVDTPAHMFLVLEYVSGGDLFDAITSATRFTETHARLMIRHLASATAYLHAMGIVHRDIKPENLLVELDADGQVTELKLADFGLACEVVQPLLAVCGTPTYVAPEILLETGYGLKIDVWAAGIILYILLCGFPPFVSPDNQQEPLFDAILSGVYEFPEPYWTGIGDEVRDLIANMLQSDPELRFSSEDVLDHPWTIGATAALHDVRELQQHSIEFYDDGLQAFS